MSWVRLRVLALCGATGLLAAGGTAYAADGDGDGFDGDVDDCDDTRADVFPGAPEVCDRADNDCDGLVPEDELDVDGDGASTCEGDCDDQHAWLNDLDLDADGQSTCALDCDDADPLLNSLDVDGDLVSSCDGDCDDASATAHPGAEEVCDSLDNDCDGDLPNDEQDDDGDGFSPCQGDCRDDNAARFPGNPEICDGLDNDCDDVRPDDEVDGDGDAVAPCAGDCDDVDPTISPNADEVCDDGIDNNCDAAVDLADVDCADEPPTVDAGVGPQAQFFGGPVTLTFDGTGSVDPEAGDLLVYRWALQDPAPQYPGVKVVSFHAAEDSAFAFLVLDIDPAQISFDAENPNSSWDFAATLTVSDGVQDSAAATVTGHAFAAGHFPNPQGDVTCAQAPRGPGAAGAAALAALGLGAVGSRRRRPAA